MVILGVGAEGVQKILGVVQKILGVGAEGVVAPYMLSGVAMITIPIENVVVTGAVSCVSFKAVDVVFGKVKRVVLLERINSGKGIIRLPGHDGGNRKSRSLYNIVLHRTSPDSRRK